jgi:hypothetical protein
MDVRERRATAALALLASLAAVLALAFAPQRPATGTRASPSGAARRTAPTRSSSFVGMHPRDMPSEAPGHRPRHAGHTRRPVKVDTEQITPATGPCVDAGLPAFPGAIAGPGGAFPRELHDAIQALPLMPDLGVTQRLLIPKSAWLVGNAHGRDPFAFYARRMRPVNFWDMPASLRTMLGLRPRGTVDSSPLLYRSRAGAVLVRPLRSGGLIAVLLCPRTTTS